MNKRILVVEDNQHKLNRIRSVLLANGLRKRDISQAMSFTTAWKEIMSGLYELAILDITLPTYDRSENESGGNVRPLGGKELARKIDKRNLNINYIFVTQYRNFSDRDNSYSFDELAKDLFKDLRSCLGIIFYENETSEWQEQLGILIKGAVSENTNS